MKKQTRKLLAWIMCLVLAVGLLPVSALAAHRAIFTADDVTAKAGETVGINVNITENEGIAAGRVTLKCDQITITTVMQGDWAIDKRGNKIGDVSAFNPEEGIWNWAYTDEIDTEGVYCTYTATINADVTPGEYPITIVADDLAGVDENGNPISYKDGEWDATQTYIATLTVLGDEPVPSADVVADTVTATCGEGETADVNISYVGESEISSIRMTIDSEIPVDSISSDYEFEYNKDNNMIIIWAKNGETFGESIIATLHIDLDVEPWYADGEYPVNIDIVEATDSEAEITELTSESGALIIDNVYKPGDVNMDGTVDNRDVIMIARYLVELVYFNEKQMKIADFDCDNNVNNTDLVLICQSIVSK